MKTCQVGLSLLQNVCLGDVQGSQQLLTKIPEVEILGVERGVKSSWGLGAL